jgi:hypothetical protein
MNHLTDQDIAKFWMGGLEDEATFNGNIAHLHQCKVCRERAWNWLKDMRDQMKKITDGLMDAIKGGATSGVVMGQNLGDLAAALKNSKAFVGVEMSAAKAMGAAHGMAMSVKDALDRLIKNPSKLEWDADDLFDNDRFDDLDHLSKCKQCRQVFEEMLHITEKVLQKSASDPNAVKLNVAAQRLQKWFQVVRMKFREIMDLRGVTDEDDSGGDHSRAFCN